MIYALVAYWLITGFAAYALPSKYPQRGAWALLEFVICMALGGIIIPARMVVKAVR